jgi:hypothetical protein
MSSNRAEVPVPEASRPHIREIERIGLKWDYLPQYDLSLVDLVGRRVQVREAEHYSPKDTVEAFAHALKSGASFPAIIVTADNWVVDANTRVTAALSAGIHFFPALILKNRWNTATPDDQAKIRVLASTLNQMNGQRLTEAEMRVALKDYLVLGWTTVQIERAIGVKPNAINQIAREQNASARMVRIGMIPPPKEYLNHAGSPTVMALNDEPYRRLVQLMVDAGLTAREVKALAQEAKNSGSDQAALEILARVRAENEERILRKTMTGNGKPSKAAQLRQALGRVLSFEGYEAQVIERSPAIWEEHLGKLERVIRSLETVAMLQREAMKATDTEENDNDMEEDDNDDEG